MKSNKKAPFTRVAVALFAILLSAASAWAVSLSDFEYSGSAYLIKTEADLNNLAAYVNAGNTCKGLTFKLDISSSILYVYANPYTPIGNPIYAFNGTFDGNGKTIRIYNKYNPTPTKVTVGTFFSYELATGVFGVLGTSAVVKNLSVQQPGNSLISTESVTSVQMSEANFGGIAGINNGTITDCKSGNTLFTVEVDAYTSCIGGIAGTNKGSIKNSTYNFALTTNLNREGYNFVGGIAGCNNGTLEANTTEHYITNTGGDAYIGGIAGDNTGTIKQNFVSSYNKNNSGSRGKGAITGRNNGTISMNGYYNLGTGIGTGSGDVFTGNGAVPVYKITVGTGVSATVASTATLTRNETKYYAYKSTVTLSITSGNSAKTGYTVGYSVDNGNVAVSMNGTTGTFSMPAKNISVARADTPINYTITYNLNGGTNPSGAATTYTVEKTVTLPTPTRSGYTFGGWYTSSNFSGSKVTSIAKGSTSNKTFYAYWTAISYTVTYNLNGGTNPSGAPASYTAQSAAITLPTPTKTGYSFAGWFTSSTFSGSKVTTIPTGSSGNKSFYAKWTPITYAVKFNANNGSDETTSQQFTYDTEKKLDANTFTPPQGKGGFLAWNTNISGNGTSYSDGQSVKNLTSTLGETVNLYAQWKKHIAYTSDFYFYDIEDVYYTGKAIEPTVTIIKNAVDVSDDFVISYSDNIEPGVASVIISARSGDSEYDGSVTRTFRILKLSPTVTAPVAEELAYNGKAQALVTAGTTNYSTLLYSLDGESYSENIPSVTNAGEYTVYFKVEEGDIWNSVAAKSVSVTVAKLPATVKVEDASKHYSEKDPELKYSVEGLISVDGVEDALADVALIREEGETVGEYAIDATVKASANPNYDVTVVSGRFTILPALSSSSSSSARTQGDSSSSDKAEPESSSSKDKSETTNIDTFKQIPQFTLNAGSRQIQVSGAMVGSTYAVFDMQGRVLKSSRVDVANFVLPVDRAGTYFVRIGLQMRGITVQR